MLFDVFLSHNSRDKEVVRDLKGQLISHQVMVWFDEDELRPGIPWQGLLEDGIKSSTSVAVLVGKDGLGPWENEEMQTALRLAVKDNRPVIPVLLPGAPLQPDLPLFLGNRTWVDLRVGLTADGVRKLVWGITGIRDQSVANPSHVAQVRPVDSPKDHSQLPLQADIVTEAALIDNWSLELIGRLFEDAEYGKRQTQGRLLSVEFDDQCTALFNFLDVLVLHDEILYEPSYSDAWMRKRSLLSIGSVLKKLPSQPDIELEPFFSQFVSEFSKKDRFDLMVEGGALKYFSLSHKLGAYYWPAPARSEFLRTRVFKEREGTFVVFLKAEIDREIRRIGDEVLRILGASTDHLQLPGFGSEILKSCESAESVLKTAMEYRSAPEAKAFRNWLHDISNWLKTGNIHSIAVSLRELRDVINAIRKAYGLASSSDYGSLMPGLSRYPGANALLRLTRQSDAILQQAFI